jgi:hypothetical protein
LIAEGIMAHTNNGAGAAPSVSTGDAGWDCLLIGFLKLALMHGGRFVRDVG